VALAASVASDGSLEGVSTSAAPCVAPPRIALTFDDGPNPVRTQQILAILAQHQVPATFFLVGRAVRTWPQIVFQTWSAGHELAIHGDQHRDLAKLSKQGVDQEIRNAYLSVRQAAPDATLTWWRAPYGSMPGRGRPTASVLGLRSMLWTIDSQDWRRRGMDNEIQTVLSHAHDGAVVLMHDPVPQTGQALDAIITGLHSQGFELVTVSALEAPYVCPTHEPPAPTMSPLLEPDTLELALPAVEENLPAPPVPFE
jgi:chitooligosaccharide deacetylase